MWLLYRIQSFSCERIVYHRDTARMLSLLCMYDCLQDHTEFHSWLLLHLQQDWSHLKPISGYFNFAPEWLRYGEKHPALFNVVERSHWCVIFLLRICEFCDKPRSAKPHYLFNSIFMQLCTDVKVHLIITRMERGMS